MAERPALFAQDGALGNRAPFKGLQKVAPTGGKARLVHMRWSARKPAPFKGLQKVALYGRTPRRRAGRAYAPRGKRKERQAAQRKTGRLPLFLFSIWRQKLLSWSLSPPHLTAGSTRHHAKGVDSLCFRMKQA